MAGAAKWNESEDGSGNQIDLCCKLEPSSASLQNCLKCSSSGRFVSMLCEFGVVLILEVGKGKNMVGQIRNRFSSFSQHSRLRSSCGSVIVFALDLHIDSAISSCKFAM